LLLFNNESRIPLHSEESDVMETYRTLSILPLKLRIDMTFSSRGVEIGHICSSLCYDSIKFRLIPLFFL
jgi:hypothetical protein